MINATILQNGNLKLSASNACRQWISENQGLGYWVVMAELFENYSCNGGFVHFGSGRANLCIGLTDAPAVAECINYDKCGNQAIEGRAWVFLDYQVTDDLEELKNKGFVIYTLLA